MALSKKKQFTTTRAGIRLLEDFRADRITRIQFRNGYDAQVDRIDNDSVRATVRELIRRVREYTDSQWIYFMDILNNAPSLSSRTSRRIAVNFSDDTNSDHSIRW